MEECKEWYEIRETTPPPKYLTNGNYGYPGTQMAVFKRRP